MPAHGTYQGQRGMRLRSLLFVPADRPERFAKAAASGADAIIIDIEDSVAPPNKAKGRAAVSEFLASACETTIIVRVNPLATTESNSSCSSSSNPLLPDPEVALAAAICDCQRFNRFTGMLAGRYPVLCEGW